MMRCGGEDPARAGTGDRQVSGHGCGVPRAAATPSWTTGRELVKVLLSPRPLTTILGVTLVVGTLMTASFQGLGVFSGREPAEGWWKVVLNYLGTLFIITLIVAGGHQVRPTPPPPGAAPPVPPGTGGRSRDPRDAA